MPNLHLDGGVSLKNKMLDSKEWGWFKLIWLLSNLITSHRHIFSYGFCPPAPWCTQLCQNCQAWSSKKKAEFLEALWYLPGQLINIPSIYLYTWLSYHTETHDLTFSTSYETHHWVQQFVQRAHRTLREKTYLLSLVCYKEYVIGIASWKKCMRQSIGEEDVCSHSLHWQLAFPVFGCVHKHQACWTLSFRLYTAIPKK